MNLTPPDDRELAAMIREEDWFAESTRDRIEDELNLLRVAMDAHDDLRIRTAAEAATLAGRLPQAVAQPDAKVRKRMLAQIQSEAAQLVHSLTQAERTFIRRCYRTLLPTDTELNVCGDPLRELCSGLVARYEKTTVPDTRQCMAILESLISTCRRGRSMKPTERSQA
jgi:hypothetical protein